MKLTTAATDRRRARHHGVLALQPLRLRAWVLISRPRLDHELAYGASPDATPALALRAQQLVERGCRRQLAHTLRRVLADAEGPRGSRLGSAVPARQDAVIEWREALLGLAERLERPDLMSPAAVARVLVFLGQGEGPLYSRSSERSFGEVVWWIADGLQLCPPHDWRCPVIMKLDPEHVAWTCARCGLTGTSDDSGVRPA